MIGADLQELPRLPVADVYKAGRLAARLIRRPHGIEFRYLDDYLSDPGPAVATSLPVSEQPVRTPAGAVPPYFAGLLPEGRRLRALRRAVKTSADDDLSLLLAVGADAIGDVQVLPEGIAPHTVPPLVAVSDFRTIRFDEVFARSIGADPDRAAIPGVQDKVSARMITVPVHEEGSSHLLKLNPPELPALVENEAFFLEAGRRSGLDVADARVVTDADGASGLLVRRFDRRLDGGTLVALPFEDGCQVVNRYPADKYAVTAEQVCAALCAQAIAPLVAARELLRQLAFAYLTGNGDCHAKNLGILQDEAHTEWRVSPAFDVPASYLYGDSTIAISVGGRRGADVPRSAFVAFGAHLRLPERAVTTALDELCDRADSWLDELDTLPFSGSQLRKLRRTVDYRRRLLRGAGSN